MLFEQKYVEANTANGFVEWLGCEITIETFAHEDAQHPNIRQAVQKFR